jgi:hypothetical protein
MLRPFNCPTSEEEWAEADLHLATEVVPAVLSAKTVDDMNLILCKGVHTYFTGRYGSCTRLGSANTHGHPLRGRRVRRELCRARKGGQYTDSIRTLATSCSASIRRSAGQSRGPPSRAKRGEREGSVLGTSVSLQRRCWMGRIVIETVIQHLMQTWLSHSFRWCTVQMARRFLPPHGCQLHQHQSLLSMSPPSPPRSWTEC